MTSQSPHAVKAVAILDALEKSKKGHRGRLIQIKRILREYDEPLKKSIFEEIAKRQYLFRSDSVHFKRGGMEDLARAVFDNVGKHHAEKRIPEETSLAALKAAKRILNAFALNTAERIHSRYAPGLERYTQKDAREDMRKGTNGIREYAKQLTEAHYGKVRMQ